MKREYKLFLHDILTACIDIQDFTSGMNFDQFVQDRKTNSAVIRQFEVIGEAVKNIPEWIKDKAPDIPWKDIAGMRDRLIHGYFGIDYNLVWETTVHNIPELYKNILIIIEDIDSK